MPDKYCKKFLGYVPSFVPLVFSITPTEGIVGQYNNVVIQGDNFLPYDSTYVELKNVATEEVTKCLCGYNGSTNINFIVPFSINSLVASYELRVVTIFNGNLSLGVANSYQPSLVMSVPYSFEMASSS